MIYYDELLESFNDRYLNNKTNNMIIVGDDIDSLIIDIPDLTGITFIDNDIDVDCAINIKIDLSEINVKDILTYALECLKKLSLVDVTLDYTISFNNKLDILKFRRVLQNYNRVVQLIFYNMEHLSMEEQMLFNELYYFNSPFFSVISLIKDNFKTYFLSQDRVLDSREDYQRLEIVKSYILTKEK